MERKNVNKEWDVFFGAKALKMDVPQYVLFVDIMGIRTTMFRSFSKSAIFIGKLHSVIVALKSRYVMKVFPVMDGAYILCEDLNILKKVISELYMKLGWIFVNTQNDEDRFIIRGGLAYGTVVLGDSIDEKVSIDLNNDSAYKQTLLFGLPMVQAFNAEQDAPPFGCGIDVTVRNVAVKDMSGIWYKWCNDGNELNRQIKKKLKSYYKWLERKNLELLYKDERLNVHKKRCEQYWCIESD